MKVPFYSLVPVLTQLVDSFLKVVVKKPLLPAFLPVMYQILFNITTTYIILLHIFTYYSQTKRAQHRPECDQEDPIHSVAIDRN